MNETFRIFLCYRKDVYVTDNALLADLRYGHRNKRVSCSRLAAVCASCEDQKCQKCGLDKCLAHIFCFNFLTNIIKN